MSTASPSLSLCMIVRNEAKTIEGCLRSILPLAPELIVVDTGSTDETPEIVRRYGARVETFDFARVDFSAARNYSLSLATGRWILVSDADERLVPSSVEGIKEIIAGEGNTGHYFDQINFHGDCEATTDYVVRLFPNCPSYRFEGRVHETVEHSILSTGGRLIRSGLTIHHNFTSHGDLAARKRKNLRYVEILLQEIDENPADISRLVFLAAEYHQLAMFVEAARATERLARLRPQDPQAHLHAGFYHWRYTGELERAKADFEEALRLRPDYVEAETFLCALREEGTSRGCERS